MRTPAEQLAALKLLREGVDGAIKWLSTEVLADDSKADRWRTDYGTVLIAERSDAPFVKDMDGFIDYCRTHVPESVAEVVQVKPWAQKQVMDRLEVVDGQVWDTTTGEPVGWAGVKPGTRYVSVRDAPKAQAIDQVLAWVDNLPKEIGT
jgi:hypothetical protein